MALLPDELTVTSTDLQPDMEGGDDIYDPLPEGSGDMDDRVHVDADGNLCDGKLVIGNSCSVWPQMFAQ